MVDNKFIEFLLGANRPLHLTGVSGSGKTTFLTSVAIKLYACKQLRVSFQEQNLKLFEVSLAHYFNLYDVQVTQELREAAGRLGLNQVFFEGRVNVDKETSGGERSRLVFLRTIFADADVFIFDEPATGVNNTLAAEMWKLLKQRSVTRPCIFTSHEPVGIDVQEVKVVDVYK